MSNSTYYINPRWADVNCVMCDSDGSLYSDSFDEIPAHNKGHRFGEPLYMEYDTVCQYCGGRTKRDARGNCAACGAPKK